MSLIFFLLLFLICVSVRILSKYFFCISDLCQCQNPFNFFPLFLVCVSVKILSKYFLRLSDLCQCQNPFNFYFVFLVKWFWNYKTFLEVLWGRERERILIKRGSKKIFLCAFLTLTQIIKMKKIFWMDSDTDTDQKKRKKKLKGFWHWHRS